MEEIKVGDYVRTDSGEIFKVIDVEKGSVKIKSNYKEWIGLCCISKHSPNIIELIEVGDYVNGILVTGKEGTLLYTEIKGIDGSGYHIPISQYGDNIENIVTKEQFKNVSYEV